MLETSNYTQVLTAAIEANRANFQPVTINDKKLYYNRIEIPLPPIDLLSWLEQQRSTPKIYWEEKDLAVAGIGSAYSLSDLPLITEGRAIRFFGGMDFNTRQYSTWGDFPKKRYCLPRIELITRAEKTFLAANFIGTLTELPPFSFDFTPNPVTDSKPISRIDCPSFYNWERNLFSQLRVIEQSLLEKVVLARMTSLNYRERLHPYRMLAKLKGKMKFAFQFSPDQTFIGATPEKLYSRTNTTIASVAIAGTRPRGKTAAEDAALKQELLETAKEQHEFSIVERFIEATLTPFCQRLQKKTGGVVTTTTVQHLLTAFSGKLYPAVRDHQLIQALHPTPALGGFPRAEAMETLSAIEPFDRGWYGAPVGWISAEGASLAVAIRSALVNNHKLHLFAGTGIVTGSIPSQEWRELDAKIAQFLS
ncbi:MAG: isochorismate synthase [Chlamydiota bacterium]